MHSQPFELLPSQLAKPELHAMLHVLLEHAPVALVAPGQTLPQLPQLLALFVMLISQPSAPDRLQSRTPMPHAVHALFEQYCDEVQDMLQAPQLPPLFVVFTSQPLPALPSQSACPSGQASTHVLDTHSLPIAHALPQTPQCKFELAVLVSQPLPKLPSQLA